MRAPKASSPGRSSKNSSPVLHKGKTQRIDKDQADLEVSNPPNLLTKLKSESRLTGDQLSQKGIKTVLREKKKKGERVFY